MRKPPATTIIEFLYISALLNPMLHQARPIQENVDPGADSHPKLEGELCIGKDLRYLRDSDERQPGLNLSWLIYAYQNYPDRENFFIPFFEKLAGTSILRKQIIKGISEEEIRTSWADDLASFKKIRSKYLIYPE